jgi:hypothetical protein
LRASLRVSIEFVIHPEAPQSELATEGVRLRILPPVNRTRPHDNSSSVDSLSSFSLSLIRYNLGERSQRRFITNFAERNRQRRHGLKASCREASIQQACSCCVARASRRERSYFATRKLVLCLFSNGSRRAAASLLGKTGLRVRLPHGPRDLTSFSAIAAARRMSPDA